MDDCIGVARAPQILEAALLYFGGGSWPGLFIYRNFRAEVSIEGSHVATGRINVSGDQLYTEELINFLGTQAALLRSPAIQGRQCPNCSPNSSRQPTGRVGPSARPTILKEPGAWWSRPVRLRLRPSQRCATPIPFNVKWTKRQEQHD